MTASGSLDFGSVYRGKTVVITGASGYIASAIVERLAGVAAKVIRVSRGSLPPLFGCADIVGDVAESETWRRVLPGAECVFHLAAQTSFYKSAEDPDADFRANVIPMRHLLEACRKEGYKPFIIFSGSTTEAGLPLTSPVDESHPDTPITVYDLHKLLSEKLLEGYARQGYARGTTLRLSNVYGPGPKSSASDRGILNAMIARALRGDRLTVYGDGSPVRDYLYIDDMAAAFLASCSGREALNGRHFVMGSGRGISLLDCFRLVAERVKARTGRAVEVVSVPEPAGLSPIESRRFVADASAFRKATGWAPTVSLKDGIDRAVDFAAATQGVA